MPDFSCFLLPRDLGEVCFAPTVLARFALHRQLQPWNCEAGGQLFAKLTGKKVEVVEATGPRPTDKRRPWSYRPDREAERREIEEMYNRELHFIGDWHSHRQSPAAPSATDLYSIREIVNESQHGVIGFFLVIVGLKKPPDDLYVALHTRADEYILSPR